MMASRNDKSTSLASKNQFVRFVFVGVINTIFGYSIFALFIFLNFHYSLAALLGTIFGLVFNFKTTGKVVFDNKDNSLIYKFLVVYGIIYTLNVIGLMFFNAMGVSNYTAGVLLIPPLGVTAFLLNKKYVFK